MKNNKGFGKFESLTLMVGIMVLIAFLLYKILGFGASQKLANLTSNASSFAKSVTSNMDSFHNEHKVYLAEVIDEGILRRIKNPVGEGDCDTMESFVDMENGTSYVTLQCGNYLIDHVKTTGLDSAVLYQVGEWQEEEIEGGQSRDVYNCKNGDKEMLDSYYDELYYVYMYNRAYGTSYSYPDQIPNCELLKKTVYRTKEEIK